MSPGSSQKPGDLPTGKTRVLIVVFDALRPDMVSATLMPGLTRFAQSGTRYSRSRCVFPSETRVNQSSLVTGCYPGVHGIVANQFVEHTACPDALFNTGDEDVLRRGDERLNGQLLHVPSLGEHLASNNLQLATLSSGTPGGGRILHHRAEQFGGFRLAMHRPDVTVPVDAMNQLEQRVGKIPPANIPSGDWLEWASDAWMQYVETDITWDVGILWMCEPDSSYHYCGIGSPDNLDAIRQADRQFSRLMDFYKEPIESGHLQVITLSDHGQLGVAGEPVNIAAALKEAGLRVGPVPGPLVDVAISVDSAGGLFCREHSPALIRRVVECLSVQPWCGVLATADPAANPMGLSLDDLRLAGPRAPDVALVLSTSDEAGPHGLPGISRHDAHYPVGGGIHGGLHPLELNNWMAMMGTRFQVQRVIDSPAGIVDVLPTLLHLLGAAPAQQTESDNPHFDGRVLFESLCEGSTPPAASTSHLGSGSVRLDVTRLASSYYLDGVAQR